MGASAGEIFGRVQSSEKGYADLLLKPIFCGFKDEVPLNFQNNTQWPKTQVVSIN
jgi:hypothetical protein